MDGGGPATCRAQGLGGQFSPPGSLPWSLPSCPDLSILGLGSAACGGRGHLCAHSHMQKGTVPCLLPLTPGPGPGAGWGMGLGLREAPGCFWQGGSWHALALHELPRPGVWRGQRAVTTAVGTRAHSTARAWPPLGLALLNGHKLEDESTGFQAISPSVSEHCARVPGGGLGEGRETAVCRAECSRQSGTG